MKYINRKCLYCPQEIETVDEFESLKEAELMLIEYRVSDTSGVYYISQRATKEWKEG